MAEHGKRILGRRDLSVNAGAARVARKGAQPIAVGKQQPKRGASNDAGVRRCQKYNAKCRHRCNGVHGEAFCPPCLEPTCASAAGLSVRNDDLCAICYTSELSAEPCVQLRCGHIYHANCVSKLLKHGWNTLQITFGFMSCPTCKQEIKEVCHQPIVQKLT